MSNIDDIKKMVKEGKVIIGTSRTIKALKLGKAEKVFLTSNCPDDVKEDIEYYGKLSKVKVVKLRQPSNELGVICKKPFSISVLCFQK
ncbi:50S ribosomal protein L30e [Candidatus Woesearchaeota archaeon]|nr:50S ribosomal protein L30e [Candidatus Woesearchaeota archaeon]